MKCQMLSCSAHAEQWRYLCGTTQPLSVNQSSFTVLGTQCKVIQAMSGKSFCDVRSTENFAKASSWTIECTQQDCAEGIQASQHRTQAMCCLYANNKAIVGLLEGVFAYGGETLE